MRKLASLMALLLLFSALAIAQTRTITGTVKDNKGNPVPFANITIKGTNTGTSADANGHFKVDVKPGQSLLVSSASFSEQEVKVGDGATLDVTLEAQGNLKEVIVTALGIKRTRNQVPYAAQQVSGEEVSKTRNANFINSLEGKISGLDIKQTNTLGGSTNAVIRGYKSITGDNQALFVVDGVPYNNANTNTANQRTGRGGYDYGNAAADINPDDIQSVTVLKGAAASALYGSQGANGVILITTKKGAKSLGVTINTGVIVGEIDKTTFPTYQKSYGGGYGQYYEDPSGNFLYRDPTMGFINNGSPNSALVVPMSEDASYGHVFDPNLMVYQWDAFDPNSPYYNKPKPWLPAANDPSSFFEKPVSYNTSIFIESGTDKGSFKIGYTRNGDQGILPNSTVDKNLLNFNGTLNLTNQITVGTTLNYSSVKGLGRYGTGYDDKNMMTNFRQWWEMNVDLKEQKTAYFNNHENVTWNWADPTDLVPIYWDNVYFSRYENYETDKRNRYFGNVFANYKPTDWLTVMGRVSIDQYGELQEERQAVGSVATSFYSRYDHTYQETNYDVQAYFDKAINSDLSFKGLLGMNIRRQHNTSISAITNGGLIVPRVYALSNSLNTPNAPIETDGIREVDGVFAGATLTWRDMLTLDATIRRDASSTLPKDHNVYYYPSVSGGFVFSKLLPSATWLSFGKLRANYAEVGNDAPIYGVYDVYAVVPPFNGNPQSSVTGTKNNQDLRPERTKSAEIGLEMSFFKNRLGFDASYYDARSFDQIMPVIVSTATGYNSKFLNAATVDNKGFELSLYGTPIKKSDFSWDINVNWSRNRNKVVKLFEGSENLVLATFQGGVSLNATLGQPYGTIRGSNFVYTNGQRTVGANGRYLISTTSNEVIGNPNPDWLGSINNTLKYKNFTFSFLIDARQGGDLFSLDLYYGMATGLYPETAGLNDKGNPSRNTIANGGGIILPGVKQSDGKTNDIRVSNTNFGTYGYRYNPAAWFVYDASYVKLREVLLSYSLPKGVVAKLRPLKGVDFSLIGRNLWIIHKNLPYSDPEETMSSGNLQGYQGGAYPSVRTGAFNIKFRF